MAQRKKIAVIGAGLGGLSAAIRLVYMGHTVHLYEQNSSPGGKAGSISAGGYRFDTGPSLLTMPFVLEELFRDVGEEIKCFIDIKPLELLCKYFYPDKMVIRAYSIRSKSAAPCLQIGQIKSGGSSSPS
jgi:phytoene desaturase